MSQPPHCWAFPLHKDHCRLIRDVSRCYYSGVVYKARLSSADRRPPSRTLGHEVSMACTTPYSQAFSGLSLFRKATQLNCHSACRHGVDLEPKCKTFFLIPKSTFRHFSSLCRGASRHLAATLKTGPRALSSTVNALWWKSLRSVSAWWSHPLRNLISPRGFALLPTLFSWKESSPVHSFFLGTFCEHYSRFADDLRLSTPSSWFLFVCSDFREDPASPEPGLVGACVKRCMLD